MESIPLDESLAGIEHSVDRLIDALRRERAMLQHLLKQIGAPDHCNGCRELILWVRHRNGAATPYNSDGSPHFATCPKASQFRKPVEKKHGK